MILQFNDINKIKCNRIGIIPYVKRNDDIFFLMGKDVRTGDVCDFGGKVDRGESNIGAAMREFMEETKEILDPHYLNTASCGVFDKRNNICILFCQVTKPGFYKQAQNLFHSSKIVDEFDEMNDVVWLSTKQMILNIYGKTSVFWNRVRYAFLNCADFNDTLIEML